MKRLTVILLLLGLAVARGEELPSVAVADFTSDQHTTLTHGLPDMIADALVNSKRFDVYEREKLNTIMREQNFQASGFADPQTAVSLGKVAGVHYIVTGQILAGCWAANGIARRGSKCWMSKPAKCFSRGMMPPNSR